MKTFCFLNPNYPKSANILSLFMIEKAHLVGILPMLNLYRDFNEIIHSVGQHLKKLKQHMSYIHEFGIILPVNLQSLFRLKKEFWSKPTLHYSEIDRLKAFLPVLVNPEFYKLLVTPSSFDNYGRWVFDATLPMHSSADNSMVQKFMNLSDYPVVTAAKYAAIYTFGKPYSINLKTKEIVELGNSSNIKSLKN